MTREELMLKKFGRQLMDITKQSTATETSNTFTLDLSQRKSFTVTIVDTNAKTIAFSNIPANMDFSMPVTIKLACTGGNTISTYPANTVWADGITPSYTLGKTSYLTFIPDGTGWHATSMGEW